MSETKDRLAPSILIVGSGALGCLFAARCAASGIAVTLLGHWRPALEAVRAHGICLVDMAGEEHCFPVQVVDDPQACRGALYALVLVKAWQTERAARELTVCLDSNGLALTLQNGLGNFEALRTTLGAERVALGVTTLGANLIAPGRVCIAGQGSITLGEHPGLPALTGILQQAGFAVEHGADPEGVLWGKLVINAAINPLTALLQVKNGELVRRSAARQLMADAAREVAAVAAAKGICLPFADPVSRVEAVAQKTAANRSSMLQDLQRGAPTEIDAICGAVVQAGKATGVPTPINHMLWLLIRAAREREPE